MSSTLSLLVAVAAQTEQVVFPEAAVELEDTVLQLVAKTAAAAHLPNRKLL